MKNPTLWTSRSGDWNWWKQLFKSYQDVIKARNEIKENLPLPADKESILDLISVKSFRSIFPQPQLLMWNVWSADCIVLSPSAVFKPAYLVLPFLDPVVDCTRMQKIKRKLDLRNILKNRAVISYWLISPSCGIFGHVTRLDQSRVSEKIWWIITSNIYCFLHFFSWALFNSLTFQYRIRCWPIRSFLISRTLMHFINTSNKSTTEPF